jgi:hypothetical protein
VASREAVRGQVLNVSREAVRTLEQA